MYIYICIYIHYRQPPTMYTLLSSLTIITDTMGSPAAFAPSGPGQDAGGHAHVKAVLVRDTLPSRRGVWHDEDEPQ